MHSSNRSSLRWLLLVISLLLLGMLPITPASAAAAYTWSNGASAPLARFEAQGLVVDGKLYVFGGFYDKSLHATARVDVYNIAANSWRRLADLPEPLTHAGQTVDGNTIYLVGGYVGNNPGPSTNHVWKYNIGSNSWSAGPALPASRGGGAVVVLNHKLHFFGGATRRQGSKSSTADQAEHFVLSLDGGVRWTTAAPLPNPRNHLGAAVLNGKAYVLGGQHTYQEGTTSQKQVDVYNPATDSWARASDMPHSRSHISASTFVMDGRLIVAGGSVNNGTSGASTTEVAMYDPGSNRWSQLPTLPSGRKTPVAGTDGTRIVVSTGGQSSATSTTWRATPKTLSALAAEELLVGDAEAALASAQANLDQGQAFFCDFSEPAGGSAAGGLSGQWANG